MCRMIAVLGDVDISKVIDHFKLMAKDETTKHENNESKKFMHNSGWGIVYTQDGNTMLQKSTKPAYEDEEIDAFKKTKINLLHARKATNDIISIENTHPFEAEKNGKKLYFCHNGIIKDQMDRGSAKGDTDSERFFMRLVSNFDPYNDVLGIKRAINSVIDYTGLNSFLLTDDYLYIISIYKKNPEYFTLYFGRFVEGMVFSSEPIPDMNCDWVKIENKTLVKIHRHMRKIQLFDI